MNAAEDERNGKSTAVVAATVRHLARSVAPRVAIDAVVSTETAPKAAATSDPNDVWLFGCPSELRHSHGLERAGVMEGREEEGASCRVASGKLLDDLWRFVEADIFVMAASSLSYVAAYLREAEQRLTLIAVSRRFLAPTHFWMFFGANDKWLPPNLYFINATSSAATIQSLESAPQLAITRQRLSQIVPGKRGSAVIDGWV